MIQKTLQRCSIVLLELFAASARRKAERNLVRLERLQWENIDLERDARTLEQIAQERREQLATEELETSKWKKRRRLPVTWVE